jgi:hypothetical protein
MPTFRHPRSAAAASPQMIWSRPLLVHPGVVVALEPGLRLVEGLEMLAWVLHPDTFVQPPAGRVRKVETP